MYGCCYSCYCGDCYEYDDEITCACPTSLLGGASPVASPSLYHRGEEEEAEGNWRFSGELVACRFAVSVGGVARKLSSRVVAKQPSQAKQKEPANYYCGRPISAERRPGFHQAG